MKTVFLITCAFLTTTLLHAQSKHTVGEKWGGGVIFFVDADGLHGLVAETQDQGKATWTAAGEVIKDLSKHSDSGKLFTDWRMPAKDELTLLYNQRDVVGGFTNGFYWSSTEVNAQFAWGKDFNNGIDTDLKAASNLIRSIRAF